MVDRLADTYRAMPKAIARCCQLLFFGALLYYYASAAGVWAQTLSQQSGSEANSLGSTSGHSTAIKTRQPSYHPHPGHWQPSETPSPGGRRRRCAAG